MNEALLLKHLRKLYNKDDTPDRDNPRPDLVDRLVMYVKFRLLSMTSYKAYIGLELESD
jgi:hypothetical protein